jgi:glycosyltransferase involved in cell wall biosynthesis
MSSADRHSPEAAPHVCGRVALVHDWLNQSGGAENVLEELVSLLPGAPVFTSIYAPERMPAAYRAWDIRTSFMQRLPGVATHHQKYLPFYPLAFQQMDLSGYDLVVSNKSGFCHGVSTRRDHRHAIHVCYCLTPTRFLWQYDLYRQREQIGGTASRALRPLLAQLRRWDLAAAQRVDHFIAISTEVQLRIRTIYGRESEIIFPPVDVDYFTPQATQPVGDYYLVVSRLIPYKRIDLAVAAFRHLPQKKLLVVGDGRDMASLKATASANVHFLGRQPRARVRELLRGCRAFLFPGLEDFGIAPVEAMSCGRPVIAFGGGGALDTVIPGVSGELFGEPSVNSLANTLAHFDWRAYSPAACRAQAECFSAENFRRQLAAYLATVAS